MTTKRIEYHASAPCSTIITQSGELIVAKGISVERGFNSFGEEYVTLHFRGENGEKLTIDLDSEVIEAIEGGEQDTSGGEPAGDACS